MDYGKRLTHWCELTFIWMAAITLVVFGACSIEAGRPAISVSTLALLVAFAPSMGTCQYRRDRLLSVRRSWFALPLCFTVSSASAWVSFMYCSSPSSLLAQLGQGMLIGLLFSMLPLAPLRWLVSSFQPSRFAP